MDRRLYLQIINMRNHQQFGGGNSGNPKEESVTVSSFSKLKLDTDKTNSENSLTFLTLSSENNDIINKEVIVSDTEDYINL